jgi:hypothetical protein
LLPGAALADNQRRVSLAGESSAVVGNTVAIARRSGLSVFAMFAIGAPLAWPLPITDSLLPGDGLVPQQLSEAQPLQLEVWDADLVAMDPTAAAGLERFLAADFPRDAYRDLLPESSSALLPSLDFRDTFGPAMAYGRMGIEPLDLAPAPARREFSATFVSFSLLLLALLGVYLLQHWRRKRYARAARSRRHIPIVGRRARSRRRRARAATRALHTGASYPSSSSSPSPSVSGPPGRASGSRSSSSGSSAAAGGLHRYRSSDSSRSGRSRRRRSHSGGGGRPSRRRS